MKWIAHVKEQTDMSKKQKQGYSQRKTNCFSLDFRFSLHCITHKQHYDSGRLETLGGLKRKR